MNLNQDDNMQDRIDAYLNNTLSKKEREVFKKELEVNPKLKEELYIYKALQESFNENDWHSLDKNKYQEDLLKLKKELKSKENQDISETLRNVEQQYFKDSKKQNNKPKRFYNLAIAASVLLLVSLSLPFIFNNDGLEDYYNTYQDWEAIPSLIEKGTTDNTDLKIETLFEEKDYKGVINYYEQEVTKSTLHPYSLLKVGNAYFYENNYKKAINMFDAFIALNTIDSSRGHWYKLLVYLKQDNVTKVEEMLDIISSNKANYNYKKASEIKDEMK